MQVRLIRRQCCSISGVLLSVEDKVAKHSSLHAFVRMLPSERWQSVLGRDVVPQSLLIMLRLHIMQR